LLPAAPLQPCAEALSRRGHSVIPLDWFWPQDLAIQACTMNQGPSSGEYTVRGFHLSLASTIHAHTLAHI